MLGFHTIDPHLLALTFEQDTNACSEVGVVQTVASFSFSQFMTS